MRCNANLKSKIENLQSRELAGVVFAFARTIAQRLGGAGTKAISKIASLFFLAAIAVMMVRKGLLSHL